MLLVWALLEGVTLLFLTTTAPRAMPWLFIVGYLAAFVAFVKAVTVLRGVSKLPPLWSIVLVSLCFRLLALSMPPNLSDDLFRYLWEGHVGLHGFNPFVLAPNAPELIPLSDAIQAQVNHPDVPSVYPPLAHALFQMLASIHYAPLAPRLCFMAWDLVTVGMLVLLLRRKKLPEAWVLIYAWNPLPILEFGVSGHLDSAAIALLLAALVAGYQTRTRSLISAGLLAASTLVKLLAVALLPVLLVHIRRRYGVRTALLALGIFVATVAFAFLPYLTDLGSLSTGLARYGQHWRFNASVFALARLLLEDSNARALMGGIFALLIAMVVYLRLEPDRAAFVLTGAFFLLSPTAHPWYLCWVLPFTALFWSPAWLLLSGTVALSYSVFSGADGWEELSWVPWLEYLPFVVVLAWHMRVSSSLKRPWGQACG